MKKFLFILTSILIVLITSIILIEISINITLLIYKNIEPSSNYSYLYVFGESPASGAPYFKTSFVKAIKYITNGKIDNKKLIIIDFTRPGCTLCYQYTSYLLYRLTHPFQKGIVLLYSGTNDIHVNEFKIKHKNFFINTLLKFNIIKFIDAYTDIFPLKYHYFYKRILILKLLNDFQYLYEKIIDMTTKLGDEVYISTIAENYSQYHPKEDFNLYSKELETIDNLFFNSQLNEAETLCKQYIEDNNYKIKSAFWFRIGKIYEQKKFFSKANKCFLNAIENTLKKNRNNTIMDISKKYNIKCIDFVDRIYNSNEIIGLNYFADEGHLSIESHIILAYEFIKLISTKHKIDIVCEQDFNFEEFKKLSNIGNNDTLRVLMSTIIELEVKNKFTYLYNLELIRKLIKQIATIELDENKSPNSKDLLFFLNKQKQFLEKDYNNKNISLLEKDLNKYKNGAFSLIRKELNEKYPKFL